MQASALLQALQNSNAFSVECVMLPQNLQQSGPARIVSYSLNSSERNFTVGQQKEQLVLRLRTPMTDNNGTNPQQDLARLTEGRTHHVVVTYENGITTCFLDGKQVYRGDKVRGDFSNWGAHNLVLGDEYGGGRDWSGTLHSVAIYDRAIDASQAQMHANALQKILAK